MWGVYSLWGGVGARFRFVLDKGGMDWGCFGDCAYDDIHMYYVEIECQPDATEVFIADFIACSTCFGHHYAHHQELKSIIQWLLPVAFRAAVFKLLSCKPDT